MREGWSGVSVAVGGRVFVIAEFGDSPVKVYEEECDTWRCVGGGRFPREVLKRPFCATGLEDTIYVASSCLNVAIGTVDVTPSEVKLTWQVVEAPPAFRQLSPSTCHLLYA
uniref:F-box protein AFR n=2 Tax=Cajanus cajan TaxID=3821 RepID=A0A151SR16_CAJCA|nr:F-box protein AFR [Cajanus cajan]